MPGKIAVAHHSLVDWDFQHGSTYRSLSSDAYISPPTSLKYTPPGGEWWTHILCRIPATLCLPQGEVRCWVRRNVPVFYPAMFRNQAPLGTSGRQNCYMLFYSFTNANLIRYIDGYLSARDSTTCYSATDEWRHTRVFWYNGKTPGDAPALCVDIYRMVDLEWVKEGSTMYDTDNTFKDSAINRCGFSPIAQNNYPVYFDDTEIWGPV